MICGTRSRRRRRRRLDPSDHWPLARSHTVAHYAAIRHIPDDPLREAAKKIGDAIAGNGGGEVVTLRK